ncbi:hypothetical protein [Acidisphaera sp. S103]|uniref:hypothetical protein n=1 Tax=Acidisphaera sp. S103 TaxID=1747223 RepID=UPI00131E0184|nr:hypothetical protein [Acidisphaera sp. S103]
MRFRMFYGQIVTVALSALVAASPAMAQSKKAQLYSYHTGPAVGGCPGLDWHVTVEPDNKLDGFVAWDRGQHIARLDGVLNKDGTFEMAASEVGGAGRKATVKGKAGGAYINAAIYGSGTPCDGINLPIPLSTGAVGAGGG